MFLETIKCENGKLVNLDLHQDRMSTVRLTYFSSAEELTLSSIVKVPPKCSKGLFRCRVLYSDKIHKIEFLPHQSRTIKSLKLVEGHSIDYKFKYSDRKELEYLYSQRDSCDEIIIVRNNFISDSFFSNILFFDGYKWWTSDTPLLEGTQRARLLQLGKVHLSRITLNDLPRFTKVGLVNALHDMRDMPIIPIAAIKGLDDFSEIKK